jgi:hypothetical protein
MLNLRIGSKGDMLQCREEKDLVLFNNRGLTHSVVGVFKEGQIRLFHQCNLVGSDEPIGPTDEDVKRWA